MSPDPSAAPLRVALLTPTYWPEVRRGGERFVHELATGLLAAGHHPRILTSHPGPPRRAVEDGVEVLRAWRPPDGRLRRRLYEDHLTHVPFSYLALRRGDDDVAHAVYPTDAAAAARWSQRTGRPAVLTYMGIPDRAWLASRRLRIAATLRALEGAGAVVALSEAAARGFRRWLGVEPRVIAPGVDLETFTPAPGRSPEPTVVCPADAGEPRKRVDLLIAAFAHVRRAHPGARLVLSRPRDAALAARLTDADEGVVLADLDDRDALARAYGEAWLTALPAISEAFGLVLAESLACGTPVVGARAGAIPEIVDRDTIGRLFDGGDERGLAAALLETIELAGDSATAVACRARAEDFSTARCVAAYEALYRELIETV